jgi:hypothetical protein
MARRDDYEEDERPRRKGAGRSKIPPFLLGVAIGLAGLVALAVVAGVVFFVVAAKKQKADDNTAPQAQQEPKEVVRGLNARGIWNTYNTNPADGEIKYAGKILECVIEVKAVEKIGGKFALIEYPAIREVSGGTDWDRRKYVAALFDDPTEVAGIKPGPLQPANPTIRCEVKEFSHGILILVNCRIVAH